MEKQERIKEVFEKAGIEISAEQTQQFFAYYQMLIKKNEVMNLTAITEFEEVVSKHFLDSVLLGQEEAFLRRLREGDCMLLDVGTGAGFPGIPLKLLYPKLEVVLLDSLNKRVQFLNEVIDMLGLSGIRAIHGRAEDLAKQKEYREQFDFCVSRAVANLATLSEYCLPFVKIGGSFVAYKSGKVDEELSGAGKAISILGGKVRGKAETTLPGADAYRCLVLVEKAKETPKKYPRKAGMPTKEPIGAS